MSFYFPQGHYALPIHAFVPMEALALMIHLCMVDLFCTNQELPALLWGARLCPAPVPCMFHGSSLEAS